MNGEDFFGDAILGLALLVGVFGVLGLVVGIGVGWIIFG